jgi:hypothetical protein
VPDCSCCRCDEGEVERAQGGHATEHDRAALLVYLLFAIHDCSYRIWLTVTLRTDIARSAARPDHNRLDHVNQQFRKMDNIAHRH